MRAKNVVCFVTVALSFMPMGAPWEQGFQLPLQRVPRLPSRLPAAQGTDALISDVPITNRHEFAYLISVSVGTQDFSVILDTGSSDFWIVSNACSTSDCEGVSKYHEDQSPSLSMSEKAFELSYLIGSVSGNIGFETIEFGPFEISSQVFALANSTVGLGLSDTGNSGILGLSFPSIAAIPLTDGETLLENVFSNFDEPNRFFAFKLGRGTPIDDANSSFTIGKLDPTITDDMSSFAFTSVSSAGGLYDYWKLPLHSLVIDSTVFPLSPSLLRDSQSPIAVLDTGTTLILGPIPDVDAFWHAVSQDGATRKNPATKMWEVRCDRGVSVSFVLGDSEKEYPVDPGDINWEEGGSFDGWCMGGIQGNNGVNSGDWLLGDVFLRNVYVTHHHENSTHPPLIGLLAMTDPCVAMAQFRDKRGPDKSRPSTPWIRQIIARKHGPNKNAIYAVSVTSGFFIGAILTLIVRFKRNR